MKITKEELIKLAVENDIEIDEDFEYDVRVIKTAIQNKIPLSDPENLLKWAINDCTLIQEYILGVGLYEILKRDKGYRKFDVNDEVELAHEISEILEKYVEHNLYKDKGVK